MVKAEILSSNEEKSAPENTKPFGALKHDLISLEYGEPLEGMFCMLGSLELSLPDTVPPILKFPCIHHHPSSCWILLFKKAFKNDAAGAMIAFIKGLGNAEKQGQSAIKVLDDMGISEVRMRDAL